MTHLYLNLNVITSSNSSKHIHVSSILMIAIDSINTFFHSSFFKALFRISLRPNKSTFYARHNTSRNIEITNKYIPQMVTVATC